MDKSSSDGGKSSRQDHLLKIPEHEQAMDDINSHQTDSPSYETQEKKDLLIGTDVENDLTTGKRVGDISQLEAEFDKLSLRKEDKSKAVNAASKRPWIYQNQTKTSSRDSSQGSANQFGISYQQPAQGIPHTAQPKRHLAPNRGWARSGERDLSLPTLNLLPRPQPTAEYLKQACKMSTKLEMIRPLLIIMDLNGCLLDRGKNKGSVGHHRPYLKELLEYSLDHHHVMIWSSATPLNVKTMSQQAFTNLQKQPIAIWDRASLRLSSTQSKQKVQVYKQLNWVWEDKEISKSHPYALSGGSWNQTNTILIDDSIEKAAAQPHNQLLVPEYKRENEKQEMEAKVLMKVVEYLKEAAHHEDVSSFIFNIPFQKWTEVPKSIGNSADTKLV